MSYSPPFQSGGGRLALLSGLALLLLLAFIGFQFKGSGPDLEDRVFNLVKAQETINGMRVDLIKSVDIEKAAVMADTDELSRSLADESLRTAQAVEQRRGELRPLIEADHVEKEMKLFHEFDECWAELQKIDKVLLEFAVENSNIKASKLSFTQGTHAIYRFKKSLAAFVEPTSGGTHSGQVQKLASDALAAGFEVHYLHAPHIAAANDQEMDRIEAQISQLDEVIRGSLKELERYRTEVSSPLLQDAANAYDDFREVTTEVLRLSRQNTNIKSFELSLGRKRKVTAHCDETLARLQDSIRGRTFEATR